MMNFSKTVTSNLSSEQESEMLIYRHQQAIVSYHNPEAFLQRGTMVLFCHASFEEIAKGQVGVKQFQMLSIGLLHHPDAPVHICRQPVSEVIGHLPRYIRPDIKGLMTHQHAVSEGAP